MATNLGVNGVPITQFSNNILGDSVICIGGVWKDIDTIYICIGGVWKTATTSDICIGSNWKVF